MKRQQETLAQKKSQLAKLMASENITVRHRNIRTAYFDLQKRVLHCPIWKDMDSNVYDLLMGHEISHALNTPLEGWHDTIVGDLEGKRRPKIKSFLNVVEDARIEKLIKRKYPGLRRPFADAYKVLHDKDIFKVSKCNGDYSKLRLIDRINLFFKVGAHLNIAFDKEEQVFVDRAENLETFQQVVQLARDIYDYSKFKEPKKEKKKKEKQEKKKEPKKEEECDDPSENGDEQKDEGAPKPDPKAEPDQSAESDDDGGEESTETKPGDSDDDPDESGDEGDDSDDSPSCGSNDAGNDDTPADPDKGVDSKSTSDPEDDDENSESDESEEAKAGDDPGSNNEPPPEEPNSETDEAFRERERELVDVGGEGLLYLDIPKANLDKIIIPHKMIVTKYEMGMREQLIEAVTRNSKDKDKKVVTYDVMAAGLNAAFHSRNKGFINMLVKEFEMRKNAHQYARQLTSKTGELDDRKLAQYRLTNDIFRKITTVTKGKSHGMIMFLDFSGSMSDIIREILEQVLVLCSFCKRISIPFDVYGFGDSHSYDWNEGGEKFTAINDGFTFGNAYTHDSFCLRHLISSNLGSNAYKRAFTMLNVVGQISNPIQRDPESDKCFPIPTWRGNINKCGFQLGGTPFNECLVASKYIIDKFKEQHHVDITNVIYLSDGDGYGAPNMGKEYNTMPPHEKMRTRIGFRDYRTKLAVITDNNTPVPYQTALTKLVALVTDCCHIGYYFGSFEEIKGKIQANTELRADLMEHVNFLVKNGFVACPNIGYDNYYYVNKAQTTYRGELQFAQGTTATTMGKMFSEHQNKKMNSKLIIKEFAKDVAEP